MGRYVSKKDRLDKTLPPMRRATEKESRAAASEVARAHKKVFAELADR